MLDQTLFHQALLFAAKAHGTQQYDGMPYLFHLCSVSMEIQAAYLAKPNFDLNTALQAAILHDTIEDTTTTPQDITEHFGVEISDIVRALSKNLELDKPEQLPDSLARIKKAPTLAALVKLADRCANLKEPPIGWPNKKRIYYREEAKIILAELQYGNEYLSQRLSQKIDQYEQYLAK